MFTIRDIIDLAIQIEENGERVYRKAAQKVSATSIAALLLQLADDEVKHAKWFSDMKEKVTRSVDDSEVEERGKRVLQGILGDQSFSLKDADFASIEEVEGLLRVAIEFEEDTVLFYEMIRSFVDDKETLDHLDTIIEEENHHVSLLKRSLLTLHDSSVLAKTSQ
ncbi:MAG: ferritin family protein [Thermodesulfobacteriota bacterium]|nr:ferritin family protein [Thermodesulfobacteriota bacterium]